MKTHADLAINASMGPSFAARAAGGKVARFR